MSVTGVTFGGMPSTNKGEVFFETHDLFVLIAEEFCTSTLLAVASRIRQLLRLIEQTDYFVR
jgi:hypothetical protein